VWRPPWWAAIVALRCLRPRGRSHLDGFRHKALLRAEHVAESLCPQDDAARARDIRTACAQGKSLPWRSLVGVGASIALMDAQQSCRFEWLEGDGAGSSARNTEHSMLTCTVTLEKIVCQQHATQRWAVERAIVIFSGHVRSSVGVSEDRGGQRAGGTRQRFGAGGRMCSHAAAVWTPAELRSPPGRKGEEHRILLRHVGARRFWCLSQMTTLTNKNKKIPNQIMDRPK
jgi:hypothetical protein